MSQAFTTMKSKSSTTKEIENIIKALKSKNSEGYNISTKKTKCKLSLYKSTINAQVTHSTSSPHASEDDNGGGGGGGEEAGGGGTPH
jgi:uncharacterized membrane protein